MKTEYNPKNEVLKKRYEQSLELNGKLSSKTVYSKIKDIRKYEESTRFKDLTTFNKDHALDFKEKLRDKINHPKQSLTYITAMRVLKNVQGFYEWLANEPGLKKSVNRNHLSAFNLTTREETIATSKGFINVPTLEQVYKTIELMPLKNDLQKRNQAMISVSILTGIRVTALTSLKIRDIDEYKERLIQDSRSVNTKFGKTIISQFYPIKSFVKKIVLDWIKYLKEEKMFGRNDPLFPVISNEYDAENNFFVKENLSKEHIRSSSTIRQVFKDAFQNAKIEYFNPHSFRHTLVQLGERICQTPEQFKAWSQNLGHESPLTTFNSYGNISEHRQCELIRNLGNNEQKE